MNKTSWLLAAGLFAIGHLLVLQPAHGAEAPPVVHLFKSFESAPTIALPYGDSVLLQAFPKQWDYPPRSQNEKVKEKELLPKSLFINYEKYNKLNDFMYHDFESNRLTINVKKNNLALLFKSINQATTSIQTDRLKSQYKAAATANTEARVSRVKILPSQANIKTFSLQLNEKLDCIKCEYPESQRRNLLINIDSDFNITDALLINASIGSDLGRSERHFYIDTKKTIHLKDFYSDELEGGFQKYQKYKLSANGKFSKLK
jgi:hypothetical protein